MAGITLKETDDTLIPTPASGKATIFVDDADGLPKYKDDTGTVSTLGGSGLSDGDYGDVTVSSGGTAIAIDSGAVTYAKMQDVSAASRLIGRGSAAGSGDPEEITLGTGLSMSGTMLNATGGVTGPGGSTDNAIARFDGTGGSTLQNTSNATISDNGALTLTGSTVTTSEPILNLSQTWNSGGVAFTGFDLNVTDTASAAGSLLANLRVGGVSQFSVNKAGLLTLTNGIICAQITATSSAASGASFSNTSSSSGARSGLTGTAGTNSTAGAGVAGTSAVGMGGMFSTTGASAQPVVNATSSATHTGPHYACTTASGACWYFGQSTELVTLSTGAAFTDSTANLLPANSIIEAVVARVTTGITTAANWRLGDSTTNDRFTSANSTLTAGTTDIGLRHQQGGIATDAAGPVQTSAAKVRITLDTNPGAGAVRVTVFWRTFIAPTS
jgi:hypothetical protein